MCQKLWKLFGSKQSYFKNKQAYFLAQALEYKDFMSKRLV